MQRLAARHALRGWRGFMCAVVVGLAGSHPADAASGRAYELVSPNDKNGGDVERDSTRYSTARAAGSGEAAIFSSKAAFADAKSGTPYPEYLSRRTATGWRTVSISPPMEPVVNTLASEFYQWVSEDLRFGAVVTTGRLTPLAPAFAFSLYLQRLTDPPRYDLLSAPAVALAPSDPATTAPASAFAAASRDLRQVTFESTRRLTADAPPENLATERSSVYEWHDGGLRLVSVLPGPGGEPVLGAVGVGAGGVYSGADYPGDHVMSADGSRIFFTVTDDAGAGAGHRDLDRALFVREGGGATLPVSISEASAPAAQGGATFLGARRADGAIAFFSGDKPLTDGATGRPGRPDLYRWQRDAPAGARLSDLTVGDPDGAGVLGSLGMADDASRLYFVASGRLDPRARAEEPNLYLWQAGEGVRYVATLAGGDEATWSSARSTVGRYFRDARVTPDGRYLVFASRGGLTTDAPAGVRAVYRYDADALALDCVSCAPSALAPARDAALISYAAPTPGLAPVATPFLARNVSGDGRRIFFDSAGALVPEDTNGRIDVYQWEEGEVELISSGRSDDDSRFLDASDDGDDVFFTTRERLVAADRDDLVDVYDARIGGGFPEPPPTLACQGDACQGPPTPAPPLAIPATALFTGPGNPRPAKRRARAQRKRCRKRHARRRHVGGRRKGHACARKRRRATRRRGSRARRGRRGRPAPRASGAVRVRPSERTR